jgi:hypothetical protein
VEVALLHAEEFAEQGQILVLDPEWDGAAAGTEDGDQLPVERNHLSQPRSTCKPQSLGWGERLFESGDDLVVERNAALVGFSLYALAQLVAHAKGEKGLLCCHADRIADISLHIKTFSGHGLFFITS